MDTFSLQTEGCVLMMCWTAPGTESLVDESWTLFPKHIVAVHGHFPKHIAFVRASKRPFKNQMSARIILLYSEGVPHAEGHPENKTYAEGHPENKTLATLLRSKEIIFRVSQRHCAQSPSHVAFVHGHFQTPARVRSTEQKGFLKTNVYEDHHNVICRM
jgi:hypothetical protein